MHYKKAPITEAIIDIQVALPESTTLELLEDFQKKIPEFSEKQNVTLNKILMQQDNSPNVEQIHTGYQFIKEDKKRIVQVAQHGFAYLWLAPYENWEAFSTEAKSKWDIYRNHFNPGGVNRIALRYINRIDIPENKIDLKEYLHTAPEIAKGLPQLLVGYFMQLTLPMEEFQSMATIKQTIVPPPIPHVTSILLDIETYRDVDAPQSSQEIWEAFEQLRAAKNKVFEHTLTEKTKEFIK